MIEGLYTAVATPFKSNGSLDQEGLRANIRYQQECGVDGLVVLGTTGESPAITPQERIEILKIARSEILPHVQFMAATGTNSTASTIELTKQAEQLGADSVLIVTPYYNKPSQTGLFHHFEATARSTGLPIVLYNIAGRAGVNIETETVCRLAPISNIVAIKEASGNIQQMMDVLKAVPELDVLSGDDPLTFPLMCLGGRGVISVISNLLPKQMKELVDLLHQNRLTEARELHNKLLPLMRALSLETNPAPIKAAMNHLNMPSGPCRPPMHGMARENQQQLEHTLGSLEWLRETATLKN